MRTHWRSGSTPVRRISEEDQLVAIGGTEVDQTPPVGWSDLVFTPNPGTAMDGTSSVV
jgi:hypothetical protein